METIFGLDNLDSRWCGGVATLGKFDAVHRGHAAIAACVVSEARQRGVAALAITFDPPPGRFLYPHRAAAPLSTLTRRLELLAATGLDATIILPTTPELLLQTPRDFAQSVLTQSLGVVAMVEGENFTFGVERRGNVETLRELGAMLGFSVTVVPPVLDAEMPISASRLRALIADGDVAAAQRMLGHPYQLTGTVAHGEGRGRHLGFPTANLTGVSTLLPATGVYATHIAHDRQLHHAATHVGKNLTFGATEVTIESFLLDFSGDLYGAQLDIDFIERIRDIVAFDSPASLTNQVRADIEAVRAVFCLKDTPSTRE